MINNSLFFISPHPRIRSGAGSGLLPEGEGMAPIIELREFMSLMSSITLFVLGIRVLQCIKIMLTGQQCNPVIL